MAIVVGSGLSSLPLSTSRLLRKLFVFLSASSSSAARAHNNAGAPLSTTSSGCWPRIPENVACRLTASPIDCSSPSSLQTPATQHYVHAAYCHHTNVEDPWFREGCATHYPFIPALEHISFMLQKNRTVSGPWFHMGIQRWSVRWRRTARSRLPWHVQPGRAKEADICGGEGRSSVQSRSRYLLSGLTLPSQRTLPPMGQLHLVGDARNGNWTTSDSNSMQNTFCRRHNLTYLPQICVVTFRKPRIAKTPTLWHAVPTCIVYLDIYSFR
jgi:hypothetical protein